MIKMWLDIPRLFLFSLNLYLSDIQFVSVTLLRAITKCKRTHGHTVMNSSPYLERLQVNFLHCQSAVFCEKLHMKNNDQITEVTLRDNCAAISWKELTTNLQMLQVVLLYVLGEIIYLKANKKNNNSKTKIPKML